MSTFLSLFPALLAAAIFVSTVRAERRARREFRAAVEAQLQEIEDERQVREVMDS